MVIVVGWKRKLFVKLVISIKWFLQFPQSKRIYWINIIKICINCNDFWVIYNTLITLALSQRYKYITLAYYSLPNLLSGECKTKQTVTLTITLQTIAFCPQRVFKCIWYVIFKKKVGFFPFATLKLGLCNGNCGVYCDVGPEHINICDRKLVL